MTTVDTIRVPAEAAQQRKALLYDTASVVVETAHELAHSLRKRPVAVLSGTLAVLSLLGFVVISGLSAAG